MLRIGLFYQTLKNICFCCIWFDIVEGSLAICPIEDTLLMHMEPGFYPAANHFKLYILLCPLCYRHVVWCYFLLRSILDIVNYIHIISKEAQILCLKTNIVKKKTSNFLVSWRYFQTNQQRGFLWPTVLYGFELLDDLHIFIGLNVFSIMEVGVLYIDIMPGLLLMHV